MSDRIGIIIKYGVRCFSKKVTVKYPNGDKPFGAFLGFPQDADCLYKRSLLDARFI